MQAEISHFVLIAAALCAVFLSLPTLLGSKKQSTAFRSSLEAGFRHYFCRFKFCSDHADLGIFNE